MFAHLRYKCGGFFAAVTGEKASRFNSERFCRRNAMKKSLFADP